MIKQIQLRGISRTPSDRLSEDGGLSESLNMYMDTAENAPALVPTDVTTDLGLPEGLSAKRIFIHKTANYENYVVVLKDKVVAYTPDIKDDVEPLTVLELLDGEEVNDIASVGNTIIVATTKSMYYILNKNREYVFLGTGVPFPYINFETQNIQSSGEYVAKVSYHSSSDSSYNHLWFNDLSNKFDFPSESVWNNDSEGPRDHKNETILNCLSALWSEVDNDKDEYWIKNNFLSSPVFVRYEVDVLGEKVSSMPILMTAGYTNLKGTLTAESEEYMAGYGYGYSSLQQIVLNGFPYYNIFLKLNSEFNINDWRDIISTIRIYISSPIGFDAFRYSTVLSNKNKTQSEQTAAGSTTYTYTSTADIDFRIDPKYEETILFNSSMVHCVKEIKIFEDNSTEITKEFRKLQDGFILDIKQYFDETDENHKKLETQDFLTGDDMKHYALAGKKLSAYNNSVALTSFTQVIDYDYNALNAITYRDVETGNNSTRFDVTYLLHGSTEDKVIKKTFEYSDRDSKQEIVYAFQIFPDSRCYKMLIKVTDTFSLGASGTTTIKYGEFDMRPHPYLDCAYYYGGIDKRLINLCSLSNASRNYSVNNIDDTENKLVFSEIDKPFVYPINRRFTFQSKVVGVAVANTALSQGQFGQFPLYVFTEDGIWAMETAADGSFVSQKPLSREVCINPDSITSIDNAVVFVTSKGVMMVQGSQVMNISPYMNGQHYVPNESALSLISRQGGFGEYEPTISDETPFTSFMRDAKVAYDYNGQRLVFISPDNKDFQYVYKIDTQTWHKVAFEGLGLVAPLNSYPECLIQGQREGKKTVLVCLDNNSGLNTEQLHAMVADFFPYNMSISEFEEFLGGKINFPLDGMEQNYIDEIVSILEVESVNTSVEETVNATTCIYDFSTVLDASTSQKTAKGILITRPFDLGMPDVFKSITSIKVRGYYDKANVRFILQGSDNGKDFYTMNSLRGKSWKMFRLFILADLEPTERISWIDVDFEPRYNNRLR